VWKLQIEITDSYGAFTRNVQVWGKNTRISPSIIPLLLVFPIRICDLMSSPRRYGMSYKLCIIIILIIIIIIIIITITTLLLLHYYYPLISTTFPGWIPRVDKFQRTKDNDLRHLVVTAVTVVIIDGVTQYEELPMI